MLSGRLVTRDTGAELCRLELFASGRDPFRQRSGPAPGLDPFVEPWLELPAPGSGMPALGLAVVRELPDEFAQREGRAQLASPEAAEVSAPPPRGRRSAPPAATWILAAGLVLLFCAALSRREDQGQPGNVR